MADIPRREAGNNKANEIAVARANLRSTVDASKLCADDDVELIARPTADSGDPYDLDITVELPVLVIDDAFGTLGEEEKSEQAEEASTEPGRLEQPCAEERAPSWLQRLESDIHCMQAKWASAAADLRSRVARVQELSSHVTAQDVLIDDLHRQVCEQTSARIALETDLKQAAARLTDLVTDQAACDFNVAQTRSDLEEAWEAIAAADSNRAALNKARFRDSVDHRAEAAAGAHGRSDDDPTLASDLRVRIEELETYIDGNNAHRSALQEKIAEYRDAHRASERRVADAQARLIAETSSRDRLWAEAADLRRCVEELATHLAERDIEQRKLTRRLEEQRATATQLRGYVVSARARSSQALDELKASKRRVADLEVLVLARDETIAGLVRRVRARDRAEGELLASKIDVEGHSAALELELHLAVEASVQKDFDCRNAQQKLVRVEALLREASHEIDDLVTAIEEKEETILSLEADLRARQDAVSMIDRGTGLFDDIDTSAERRRATVDSDRRH